VPTFIAKPTRVEHLDLLGFRLSGENTRGGPQTGWRMSLGRPRRRAASIEEFGDWNGGTGVFGAEFLGL
jgi:hypothetical protein